MTMSKCIKLLLFAVIAKVLFSACDVTDYSQIDVYHINDSEVCSRSLDNVHCVYAVYETKESELTPLREVQYQAVQSNQLDNPGKIYVKDNHLFSVMDNQGIAVFEVQGQDSQQIAFIEIAGVTDLSISGRYLYANNFNDLVKIDLFDLQAPVTRVADVLSADMLLFADQLPEDLRFYAGELNNYSGLLVGYRTLDNQTHYFINTLAEANDE